ncbi:GNAT family N-acetyltransferase [Steroidobacter cummioxidans]|uniref:GNAT family N-acetyltransferase n=1 Tax=Steroidobacter cummioxidans TaxID=1803913 RepID=UPI000E30CD81|nr:GNAT family N-acetyltransferase [Steroidobacter cummioxidans]
MAANLQARIITSIDRIPAAQWNALALGGNPFVRHEFLLALERAGCVGKAAGWLPHHLLLEEQGQLVAAMPLYRKSHSWGEFVFDWSWARAYDQAGLRYYPKLVSMPPFTPAMGPRLLLAPDASPEVRTRLSMELLTYAKSQQMSSAHLLFLTEEDRASLSDEGYLWRKDCQFHWHNRGYKTFDDFIATFRSDKRKKALRERRRVREGGVTFRTLSGAQMDAKLWNIVFGFSAATFESHGHEHYLNVEFFQAVSEVMPHSVVIKLAEYQGHPIATAIFFRGDEVLYGRYWGAAANFHSLHFETCYYQGIEYCIEHGLQHFEPGTQGEHKVPRGFEPTPTWSAHWIADPRFRRAIDHYLNDERAAIDQYILEVEEHTPYHRGP